MLRGRAVQTEEGGEVEREGVGGGGGWEKGRKIKEVEEGRRMKEGKGEGRRVREEVKSGREGSEGGR